MSTTSWVCEYCGDRGRTSLPVDQVQCPTCAEAVVPAGQSPDRRSSDRTHP